ncbi:MAG: YicC/YloC family endoribonuclease, partial [Woeseiaceae bacterium]|nr:YicC/YloC family endoribonuclease [Woeseiaceae bacterium]
MLNSMTGFARETAETAFGTMTCEMRAVNHRYLDVQFRLPEELRAKELDLRNRIGASLKRGKVECSIYLKRGGSNKEELNLNEELVAQIAARAGEISKLLPDSQPLDPVDVLRWPGVVAEPEVDTEPLFAESLALMEKALQAMVDMRAGEGGRIAGMIEARLAEILSIAATVRE